MLTHLSRFTRTTPGLEKTLRLFQSFCVLALQLDLHLDAVVVARCGVARSQLALTRRFLRFFNFIDCFNKAFALVGGSSRSVSLSPGKQTKGLGSSSASGSTAGFKSALEICKWGCFGLYFLLEDVTLLHATGIYPLPSPLNKTVLTEANKFWFYALVFSLLGAWWGVLFPTTSSSPGSSSKGTKSGKKAKSSEKKRSPSAPLVSVSSTRLDVWAVFKRVLVDACDLLIPGMFLGWVDVSELGVGVGMVVSTVVSGWEIWKTV
ncbi:hypothetical protein BO70DRAFT_124496 [Aspergillus heteromorphus CBS 117.55]|uniref:PEX11 domain protein n=1 Tax=Aspergillus heteromorphus CBS 117.55 TaxID=1448321 RepID=A0A317VGD2_9EURO|nr:uncharacterized protein BO70DRAFT_124496 [Aspergillus heteromorphus CBS 117.55]PWY70910.1 hypothetical protein BO70DRAFT_124496 [Aspergillus heteromorphus CBS 117.55]